MSNDDKATLSREALETMVAEADTGGRKVTGLKKKFLFAVALSWASRRTASWAWLYR